MTNFPKISIITPSFNQGQYLEHTILSILGQDYPNLEYIIIDGGSTDNSVEIIKKYADRINYWVSEPDRGQSDALNKGLAKCTGDIFNWINSDDYLEPNALFAVAAAFDKNTDIVCGYSRIFDDKTNDTILHHRTELFDTTERTMAEQKINQQGMFYRLKCIQQLGGINRKLHFIMDLEMWWRYLARFGQYRMKRIETILAHFRIHDTSKTGSMMQNFRDEEAATWSSLLRYMKFDSLWIDYFKRTAKDAGTQWHTEAIRKDQLKTRLAQRYMYPAYTNGERKFCRSCYLQLLTHGKLPFNFQSLAMFVKLFIGNISFRKYFRNA